MSPFLTHPDGPIVLLGDSDAQGWKLERIGDIQVLNKGHAGDRTRDMMTRFERDVIAVSPRAVIVFGFDNDLFDPPGKSYERAGIEIRENYERMTRQALQHGIEPILGTGLTEGHRPGVYAALRRRIDDLAGRSAYEDRLNREILDINAWLRMYASQQGVLLLDLQPAVSDSAHYRLPEYAASDGSHISEQGYAALTKFIEPVLLAHFAASAHGRSR
jgi:lysophospholipase L1-like esterase